MWRALSYLEREVYPALAAGACVLVVTHAHTIRALRLHLEGLREADAASLAVPTGSVVRYAAAGHALASGGGRAAGAGPVHLRRSPQNGNG